MPEGNSFGCSNELQASEIIKKMDKYFSWWRRFLTCVDNVELIEFWCRGEF